MRRALFTVIINALVKTSFHFALWSLTDIQQRCQLNYSRVKIGGGVKRGKANGAVAQAPRS